MFEHKLVMPWKKWVGMEAIMKKAVVCFNSSTGSKLSGRLWQFSRKHINRQCICRADSSASDDSAADGSVFKIGSIGPTTGDAAIYGNAVKNVAQMAVDEINAAGGANGYQLAFKAEDDQNDAEKSVNAYNSLKDWGMQILMGTVTTTPCVAVADKTAEDGMFEVTPSASSTDVIANDNVFQACFTDPNQGTKSAQYIGDNNLGTKVAVIYNSSSVYSSGIEANFRGRGTE